ncbi:hypothetical protein MATL_G00027090 [Megalops atlanticus]|uniref:SAM domain-containing protein n=1 Tax=Megalops atlanticus TaxID=7932 RepID=A0A9D3QD70_MEGAT|nr:hypothetical protein MATL_G00027090 [Megalops atlanticus]
MKHLAISKWLTQLGLPEYCTLFDDEYDGVEDLLHLTELDLQQLGVRNRVHRVHILSSIQVLQERERRRGQSQSQFPSLCPSAQWGIASPQSRASSDPYLPTNIRVE